MKNRNKNNCRSARFSFKSICLSCLITLSILMACPQANAQRPYARAGWTATLSTRAHGVQGTVTIVDANTFRVDNFYYDGGGVNVHFIVAADEASFASERIVTARNFLGSPFTGGSVVVDLPAGTTLDGQNAVSLWCIPFSANFGSGTFTNPNPDDIAPELTLTTPTASMSRTVSTLTGDLRVTGTANDNTGVSRIEVQVNEGDWLDVPLIAAPSAGRPNRVTFDTTFPGALTNIYIARPASGTNTVNVRAVDIDDNLSPQRSSVVRMTVRTPLTLTLLGTAATRLISGIPTRGYEVGRTYTLSARRFDNAVLGDGVNAFSAWSGAGISGTSTNLTFQMTPDLVSAPELTATYIPTPFQHAKVGRFDGLVRTAAGSTVSHATNGYFTTTITNRGNFSGTVTIEGRTHRITGFLGNDGVAMFGSTPTLVINRTVRKLSNLSLSFAVDLAADSNQLIGTLSDGTNTSTIVADRAAYSSANPLPANFLNEGSRGVYTFALPSKPQTLLTAAEFSQGDSVGRITITPAGWVRGSVYMADGNTNTVANLFATTLSKDNTFPFFAGLYRSGTSTRGSVSGIAELDDTEPTTDVSGTDFIWFRPANLAGSTRYPNGWSNGAQVDLQGAKYNHITGTSVLPNLPATANTGIANADLSFSDGPITSLITKSFNLSTANAVKIIPADPSFTFALRPSSGLFGGRIVPTGGIGLNYRGIILQKGTTAGGYGFVIGATEAGGVSLFHR